MLSICTFEACQCPPHVVGTIHVSEVNDDRHDQRREMSIPVLGMARGELTGEIRSVRSVKRGTYMIGALQIRYSSVYVAAEPEGKTGSLFLTTLA